MEKAGMERAGLEKTDMEKTGIDAIVAFVLELDQLKGVLRKVKPTGMARYENSAEHTWHTAMLALSLAPHASPDVNLCHVVEMLLVHDIGEIDTGDTLFFVEGGWEERKAAELRAVERIFGLLGAAGDGFLELWKEFEEGETTDARFARTADRAIPVLLNLSNGGGSWRENAVSYETVVSRVGPLIERGCPALWTYVLSRLDVAREQGFFTA
jgi:putative hydrolase of HD superfamily